MIIDEEGIITKQKDTQYLIAIGACILILTLNVRSVLYSIAMPIPHYFKIDVYTAFWFLHILLGLATVACVWLLSKQIWRRVDRGSFAPKRFAIFWLVLAVFSTIISSYFGKLVNDHMQELQAQIIYPSGYFTFVSIYAPIFWNLEVLVVILILMRRR